MLWLQHKYDIKKPLGARWDVSQIDLKTHVNVVNDFNIILLNKDLFSK